MKSSLLIIAALMLTVLTTSCNKEKEQVYIRFENKSQVTLNNARITYYFRQDGNVQAINLFLGNLKPQQVTGYIGFDYMTVFSGGIGLGLEALKDGQLIESMGRCGTGAGPMTYGNYTASLSVDNYIHIDVSNK